MPVQIDRRLPQSGRIRIGQKGARGEPQRLETFRFTSPDQGLIEEAARLYGGEARAWKDREGEFELISDAKELPVIVTPEPLETWYEDWTAAGCQRRCDGRSCTVPDGNGGLKQQNCVCDPDRRQCKLKTRVNLLLPELYGLGVWRLDTGSYFTAAELPGQVEILQRAACEGRYPEAKLAIEIRRLKTRDERGKTVTRIFPVVVLRLRVPIGQLLGFGQAQGALPAQQRALPVNTETGEVVDDPMTDEPAGPPAKNDGPRNGVTVATPTENARKAYFVELGNPRWKAVKKDDELRYCFEAVLLEVPRPLTEGDKADWTDYEWNLLREELLKLDADSAKAAARAAKDMLHAAHAAAQQAPAPAPEVEAQVVEDVIEPYEDPSDLLTGDEPTQPNAMSLGF